MPIRFKCPACQAIINAPDAAGGKSANCPQCKSRVGVPIPQGELLPPLGGQAITAPMPPPPAQPAAESFDFDNEDQEQDEFEWSGGGSPKRRRGAISPSSRLVTLLLCFFLGPLGAHRFYVGKAGTGLLMLFITLFSFLLAFLPLVIVGIWLLVDLIIILVGSFKDSKGKVVYRWLD